jgi:serine/threonine protein kinase/tetratricopeptide (TPR) repeat protein
LTDPPERLRRALGDRYRIERELGAGGMAVVYLATDLRRGRTVAVKVLRPELASLIGPERFLREIEISGKLNHPNILPLFDAGDADGLPYFVMPFITGESLRDLLIREGQLPVPDALQITREVADALSYAHAQGFIHRDIKPENIMLSSGHALVADFGIARAVTAAGGGDRLTGTGMAIGTVDYMSPEQATGSSQVDGRSDLYSLACVLYEMLVGGPPFAAPTAQAVMARHLVDPVPPIRTVRSTVPVAVEAAILAAMAKSKADRFANVKEFVEALDGKRPSPSQPYPAAVDLRARPRQRVLIAASVVGLLLVLGTAYLMLRPPAMDDHRVLVGVFENRTGDRSLTSLGTQATTEVVSGLSNMDSVQVVDVRSMSKDSVAVRDLAGLRKLARKGGEGSVVLGDFQRRGDSLVFQPQMIATATGLAVRPLRAVSGPLAGAASILAQVRERVAAGYAAHFDARFTNYRTISQPATYEAYREYFVGADFGGGSPDSIYGVAEKHLRRAIAADSEFMAPRIDFVMLMVFTGECVPRGDSVAASIIASGRKLLPADDAQLRYFLGWCHPDARARYDAMKALYPLAPDVPINAYNMALAITHMNRPREAVEFLQATDRQRLRKTDPGSYWNSLTWAYHQMEQYQKALDVLGEARGSYDETLYDRDEVRQRAGLGQVAEVNRLLDGRMQKSSLDRDAGDDFVWAGEELRSHGNVDAGKAACDRAVRWYGARPHADQESRFVRGFVARALYCAEHWEDARRMYERFAAEDTADVGARRRLGALAVRRGDQAEAGRIDDWLAAREGSPAPTGPQATYGRAVLAVLRGDRDRAFLLFQRSWERTAPYFQGGHVDPDLESVRSLPNWHAVIYPTDR